MKGVLPLLWLVVLSAYLMAPRAAEPAQADAAQLYRCRDSKGVIALVSKPDRTMGECVRVWSGNAPAAPAEKAPATAAEADSNAAAASPREESVDAHEARVRAAKAGILQWCQDHLAPGTKEKAKAKALNDCMQDKFGTYMLLNP